MDSRVLYGCIIAIAGMLVLYVIFLIVQSLLRSRFTADPSADRLPYTLPELRDMHAKGLLSKEEFEKLKQSLINDLNKPMERKDKGR